MGPEILIGRCVIGLRLDGHDFDAIAFGLAEGAIDALVASGFRDRALERGLDRLIDAMWEHLADLRTAHETPDAPPAVRRSGLALVQGGEP